MDTDTRVEDVMEVRDTDGGATATRTAGHTGALSRPARRDPLRAGGTRRRSTRIMRDIIKALTESMQALAQEEQEATAAGRPLSSNESGFRPIDFDPVPTRTSRSSLTTTDGDQLTEMPSNDETIALRPTRIKLLRSQDLWSEPPNTTVLTCDYCHNSFCLQDGGAAFESKAACINCEQRLNRDVVLPAIGQMRPHLKQAETCVAPTQPFRAREQNAAVALNIPEAELELPESAG